MEVKISKKDIAWSYIANFFNLGANLLVLPVILNRLSATEIGMNYIMLSVGALVSIVDMGFSELCGRSLTYVLSGSKHILKKGVDVGERSNVDFYLLRCVIETAKFIYRRISLFTLIALLTLGTAYMYKITHGFSNVQNSLLIWILYSVSCSLNLYFIYYGALLRGTGKIQEMQKAIMYNKLVYIIICFILLFCGLGLLSVVIANLVSPFVGRYYSYKKFYTKYILENTANIVVKKNDIHETFSALWQNAKLFGLTRVGSYACSEAGVFISGLFLPMEKVASYGLMVQLYGVVRTNAETFFHSNSPYFCSMWAKNNNDMIIRRMSLSIMILICIYVIGGGGLTLFGAWALELIHSNTALPCMSLMLFYLLEGLLHSNHSIFATLIVTKNEVPFVKSSLVAGAFIILLNIIFLKYFNLGIWSLVLSPFLVDSCYNHWRWPMWVLSDLKITPFLMLRIGYKELVLKIKNIK